MDIKKLFKGTPKQAQRKIKQADEYSKATKNYINKELYGNDGLGRKRNV